MNKIIIEVGSTNTKIDLFDGQTIKRLEEIAITFKKNYIKNNKIDQNDIDILINKILKLKKQYNDIYICGTSIFRTLPDDERDTFLNDFKEKTGFDFNIISSEKENELTVMGATRYEKNYLYYDTASPIIQDIETRIKETKRYFKEISLDEIRSRVSNPDWWYATRAMCAFVLVVSKHVKAKYIVPTNIAMVYGLIKGDN